MATAFVAVAQDTNPKIDAIDVIGDSIVVRIESSAPMESHVVEWTDSLQAGWRVHGGFRIRTTDLGGLTRVEAYISQDELPPAAFIRIAVSEESGLDSDGDGLTDEQELRLGTDPLKGDSDGDLFGDQIEAMLGTDPLKAESIPPLQELPQIEFASATSTAKEGAGVHRIIIRSSRPFSGTLRYRVLDSSSAMANGPEPDYAPLSGALPFNGTSALLDLQLVDDLIARQDRRLAIEIEYDSVGRYLPGLQRRHTVQFAENDRFWTGVLREVRGSPTTPRDGDVGPLQPIRVLIAQTLGRSEAFMIIPNEGNGGDAPRGRYPMEVKATPQEFALSSRTLPSVSGLVGGDFQRELRLRSAADSAFGNFRGETRIAGDFEETLTAELASEVHLNRTRRGFFILELETVTLE